MNESFISAIAHFIRDAGEIIAVRLLEWVRGVMDTALGHAKADLQQHAQKAVSVVKHAASQATTGERIPLALPEPAPMLRLSAASTNALGGYMAAVLGFALVFNYAPAVYEKSAAYAAWAAQEARSQTALVSMFSLGPISQKPAIDLQQLFRAPTSTPSMKLPRPALAPSSTGASVQAPSATTPSTRESVQPPVFRQAAQSIQNVYNTYPVVERIREEVRYVNVGATGDISDQLNELYERIQRQIGSLSTNTSAQFTQTYQVVSQSQRIDQLGSVDISDSDITGGTITGSTLSDVSFASGFSLGVASGGTGTTTAPSYGQLLLGNSAGGYDLVATSSLGITGGGGASLTGTTGQLAYFSGTDTAVGTSTLFIATTGGIGIGTTTPAGALQITHDPNDDSALVLDQLNDSTALNSKSALYITNTDPTESNWGIIGFGIDPLGSPAAKIGVQFTDRAQNFGDIVFGTRNASGMNEWVRLTSEGNFGIGTSNPGAKLEVAGGASTTRLSVFDVAYFGGSATSSFDSTGSLSLAAPLATSSGGTGISSYSVGDILYVNSVGTLARLAAGSAGQVLKISAGVPSWGADATGGGGAGAFATSSDNLLISPTDTDNVLVLGASATSTTGNIFEVNGASLFRSIVTAYGAVTAPYFSATSSTASTFTGGLLSLASTTIGGGSATTGLTISGGATTTGNAYFGGNVGIGVSPAYTLDVAGRGRFVGANGAVGAIGGEDYVLSLQNNGNSSWLEILNQGGAGQGVFFGVSDNRTANAFELWNYQAGPIDFFTSTDASDGSNRLRIAADGKVGIGTTSPWGKLSVAAADNASAPQFVVASSTSASFVVTSSGNVGLGTANPDALLTLAGGSIHMVLGARNTYIGDADLLPITPTGGPDVADFYITGGTNNDFFIASQANGTGEGLRFGNASDAGATFTEYMTILGAGTGAGRVGIGTTSPGSILSVQGVGNFVASATSTFYNGLSLVGSLNVGGSATSTFAQGINLSGGCFSINGTCVGGSSVSSLNNLSDAASDSDTLYLGTNVGGDPSFSGDVVVGPGALSASSESSGNAILGYQAASAGSAIHQLSVLGYDAFRNINSTTGGVAIGLNAGYGESGLYSASGLVLVGYQAGYKLQTGANENTLIGQNSGYELTTGLGNVLIGSSNSVASREQVTTGNRNIAIGYRVALPSQTANYQLNIGNLIYGTGLDGTDYTVSTGNVGIGTTTPYSKLTVWGGSTGNIFEAVTSASTTALRIAADGFATTTLSGLNISGSATSTSNVGFNLSGGCFAINGTCVGGGSGGVALGDENTWTALQTFQLGLLSQASSTIGGGTATTGLTISGTGTTTGAHYVGGGLTVNSSTGSSFLGTGDVYLGSGTLVQGLGGAPDLSVEGYINTNAGINTGGDVRIGGSSASIWTALGGSADLGVQGWINANTGLQTAQGSASTPGLVFYSTNNTGIFATDANASAGLGFSTQGSERLRISNTGNVGIGTTTPWAKFSIANSTGDTAGQALFTISSSTASATTTLFHVANSGKVGVGTQSPTALFTVEGGNIGIDGNASAQQFFGAGGNVAGTNTTGGVMTVFGHAPNTYQDVSTPPHDGSNFVGAAGFIARGFSESAQYRGSLEFFTKTASAANATSRMVITHDGNVGIGDTSPAALLTVGANDLFQVDSSGNVSIPQGQYLRFAGATADQEQIGSTATGQLDLFARGAINVIADTNNNDTDADTNAFTVRTNATTVAGATSLFSVRQSGNVGVGATEPSHKLTVAGGSNGAASTLKIQNTSGAADSTATLFLNTSSSASDTTVGAQIQSIRTNTGGGGSNELAFSTSLTTTMTEHMRILASGNVGIGTTSPLTKLSIQGTAGANDVFNIASSTGASLLYVNASGNVGVGTASPGGKLHVYSGAAGVSANSSLDDFVIEGSGDTGMSILTPNSNTAYYGFGDPDDSFVAGVRYLHASDRLDLISGNSTGVSVLGTGHVGIGNTDAVSLLTITADSADSTDVDKNQLTLRSRRQSISSSATAALIGGINFDTDDTSLTSPGTTTASIRVIATNTHTTSQYAAAMEFFTSTGVTRTRNFRIGPTGNISLNSFASATGNTVCYDTTSVSGMNTFATCSSDERLKHDIATLQSGGLERILSLRPVNFVGNDDASGKMRAGFIAQEVLGIIPEAIGQNPADGYYTLDTGSILSHSVKAIQELNLKVESIASTTLELAPESLGARVFASLKTRLITWFADAASGIGDFFANRVRTKELCVGDGSGETCITRAQLDALIAGVAQASSSGGGGGGGQNESPTEDAHDDPVDTEAPVITIHGNNPAVLQIGEAYSDLGASVSDPSTGSGQANENLGIKVSVNGGEEIGLGLIVIDTSLPGEHTIEYRATDQAGNVGTATRTVLVVDPNPSSDESASVEPNIEPLEEVPTDDDTDVEEVASTTSLDTQSDQTGQAPSN